MRRSEVGGCGGFGRLFRRAGFDPAQARTCGVSSTPISVCPERQPPPPPPVASPERQPPEARAEARAEPIAPVGRCTPAVHEVEEEVGEWRRWREGEMVRDGERWREMA